MATTMNLIAKQTVGSGGASSVTFSNIPQTFTDLKVVASARSARADNNDPLLIEFNGSTTGYSMKALRGTGSAAQSISDTSIWTAAIPGSTATSSTFGNVEAYIPNYTSTNPKSISSDGVGENNATTAYSILSAGLWDIATDAAITSVKLYAQNGNLTEFSTFYLYGISNSSTQNTLVPLASGGDIITTDGSYWYHTFLYSGTFTPLKNLTCDYLVVAGGGGGGTGAAGGGGAGGYRTSIGGSQLSLVSNTAYTATVGAGGVAATTDNTNGNAGGNSVFASITSTGGGYGAGVSTSSTAAQGGPGGSGGGGNGNFTGGATGGTGNTPSTSPSQGNNGGTSYSQSGARYGAGGGGAGAVGGDSTSSTSGAGGNGTANSISGSSVTYAGGGGGGYVTSGATGGQGAGGTGGGGSGGGSVGSTVQVVAVAGTANRGGGGGGGSRVDGSATGAGANGGSGIIVVRYVV